MPKGPRGEKRLADVIGAAVKVHKNAADLAGHGGWDRKPAMVDGGRGADGRACRPHRA